MLGFRVRVRPVRVRPVRVRVRDLGSSYLVVVQ